MARAHLIAVRLLRQPDGSEPDEAPLPIAATGAVIGRSPDCDVVLEDPLRLVSRQHAQLVPQGGDSALLRCISASVSIGVNGEALPPGGERLVKAGDRLRIGGFELQIEVPAVAALPEAPAVSPLQMLEEVLGSKAAASAAASPAMQPAPDSSVAAPLARSRLDAWFDLETVADPLAPGSPLPATDAPTAVAPAPAPAPATTSPAAAIPAAPAAAVPAPMPAPEPSPAASPASGDPAALLQAFVRGAGLNGTALPGTAVNAAWLQHLGAVLRAATEGTLALLRSRAVTKRSIRAEGTRIAPRENNPLKFAPDAAEALALLVGKNSAQGFLDPVEALHDAHNDLLVHQLAMVAGMRAAVFELISRLGPEAIETQQGQPQGWAKHLPLLHDAALWRRHRAQHAHLIANLDDDFETVFGREFLLAYEAQAKLAAAQKAPPSAQV